MINPLKLAEEKTAAEARDREAKATEPKSEQGADNKGAIAGNSTMEQVLYRTIKTNFEMLTPPAQADEREGAGKSLSNPITLEAIKQFASEVTPFKVALFESPWRASPLTQYRHVLIYFALRYGKTVDGKSLSRPVVGKSFRREQSTPIHAQEVVGSILENGPSAKFYGLHMDMLGLLKKLCEHFKVPLPASALPWNEICNEPAKLPATAD